MEWYKQDIEVGPSISLPRPLIQLCLHSIYHNFTFFTTFAHLPTSILQLILQHMLRARKMGSRVLNEFNIHKFLVQNLDELDLGGFWVIDQPIVDHFNSPYLRTLNLKDCLPLNDESIEKICSVSKFIEVMILKNLNHLTDKSAQAIAQHCKQVQVLVISCQKMSESGVTAITQSCKALKVFKVHRGTNINSMMLAESLSQLPVLEVISISRCQINDAAMQKLLSIEHMNYLKIARTSELTGNTLSRGNPPTKLNKLKFVECARLANIGNIIALCPLLDSLHFNTCKKLSSESVLSILEFPSIVAQMASFSFQHNTRATNDSLQKLVQKFGPRLSNLDFTGCTRLANVLAKPTTEAQDRSQLECLVLDTCNSMTFFSGGPEVENEHSYPNLLFLDLSGITLADDVLIRILTPLELLHTLQINCSSKLNGTFLLEMAESKLLPRLLRLQANKCIGLKEAINYKGTRQNLHITSPTLRFLDISYTKIATIHIDCPELEILDVSGNALTTSSLEENISRVPKLTNFWAKSHPGINAEFMRTLAKSCSNMQVMDISFCEHIPPSVVVEIIPLLKCLYPNHIVYRPTLLTPRGIEFTTSKQKHLN